MSLSSLNIFRNGASCNRFAFPGEGKKMHPK